MRKLLILICIICGLFIKLEKSHASTSVISVGIEQDTHVEEGYPFTYVWNTGNLYLGWDSLYNKKRNRVFISGNIQSLFDSDIRSQDIVSAKLFLWQYYTNSNGSNLVEVYDIPSSFNQYSVNWFNQPLIQYKNIQLVSNQNGFVEIDVQELLQKKFQEHNNQLALSIRNTNEVGNESIFWSKDCLVDLLMPRCASFQIPYFKFEYINNIAPLKAALENPISDSILNYKIIEFVWSASTDPDMDLLTYRLLISESIGFENIEFDSGEITDLAIEVNNLSDGVKFVKVVTCDERKSRSLCTDSDIIEFEVDTTPPSIPEMIPEPGYTYKSDNTIGWNFDRNSDSREVVFTLQILDSFNNEIIRINSIKDFMYTVKNLLDGTYCYRALAIDVAGNASEWSEQTCSTIDTIVPVIDILSIDEQYISPKISVGIKDRARITFSISESNIDKWKLVIEDKNRNEVFVKSGDTKENQLVVPDETGDLIEGYYFVYVQVLDLAQNYMNSQIIAFVIDNSPPATPEYLGIIVNAISNSKEDVFQVRFDSSSINSMRLNESEIYLGTENRIMKLVNSYIEGSNLLQLESCDKAGNCSINEKYFMKDWTPPNLPYIELVPDNNNKSIDIKIVSKDEYKKAYIFNMAGLHLITDQERVNVIQNWIPDTDYSFSVSLEDFTGNISNRTDLIHFLTPSSKFIGHGNTNDADFKYPIPVDTSTCFYKINQTYGKIVKESCRWIPPILSKVENYSEDKKKYILTSYSGYNPNVSVIVDYYKCREKSFWDPRTWFGCLEQKVTSEYYIENGSSNSWLAVEGNVYDLYANTQIDDYGFKSDYLLDKDLAGKQAAIYDYNVFSIKLSGYIYIDEYSKSPLSNSVVISPLYFNDLEAAKRKYFRFPFSQIIDVTQWHGYTAYDSPHTGIDFASYLEPVYSMADGYVASVGWDNYYGECYSGGNYIKILYDNGMSSFMCHLDNYKKSNGNNWQIGERVAKGDLIGISGNTGAWYCAPLGYHLHLELRKDLWQSSHIDPVPLVDVDWGLVKTYDAVNNPGRLSGDNPHPNF